MKNLIRSSIKKISVFFTLLLLFGCKKDEKQRFNFILTPTEVETRSNYVGYISITSGNGSYTIKVKDEEILDANFTTTTNAPFGAISLNGKKKGETVVSITDNIVQSTREVKVKITDFYLPLVISKSSHPTFKDQMRIFLVNNEKKDAYFFFEEGDKYNLKQKGTYKFISEMKGGTKTPFLLLSYSSDENGKFTDTGNIPTEHKFDLTGSNSRFYDAVHSSLGVNWELPSFPTTKSSPTTLIFTTMKEIDTDFSLEAYLGFSSSLDFIPNGYLD
ncbi:hypothetical protein [Sphingobacterium zeae]|nr:hypothetical protein [Sphingobacterium zeae]